MRSAIVVAFIIGLVGCGKDPATEPTPDQCLRTAIFSRCLQVVPKAPGSTIFNDWDEVVNACEKAAYYQSLRRMETIPEDCRAL